MKKAILYIYGKVIIVFHLLLFPFILFKVEVLKPIMRWFLRKELNSLREELHGYQNRNRELRRQVEILTEEKSDLNNRIGRLKTIVRKKTNDHYRNEITLTKNDELVVITYNENDIFDTIYLNGEMGDHPSWDCKIELINQTDFIKKVKIADFLSNKKGDGYGRTLLNFLIKEAKKRGIKKIYGDLAYTDRADFDKLIPFYESVGFTCRLFKEGEERYNKMEGKISMIL
ncbi:GNAT family N-acetyltransferase [Riemerella anatipestifer]|uniref:GNAT family N-acetyltransferase n=1 Tax=Riemerella anatipestifer TaxID=34085 RepID=UPI00129D28D3|nr:GNAT family N-acetyltransferase [Riemerella anatipestifer]MBT0551904.1 GNAT family N-acetyltransferase [Riemerella anatipestifer]MBT0554089.1 GNAT family N-acetyltransferase [Riemerella anatipestifer]MCE3024688.1 GNAT family N-acetyltransferase [Riemerella anatipestifer]MCU7560434.1 GNAT family N-acetyltransferase [Riemerella anatipestifer]MDY3449705.1 GNAT family N-acetyltransferase [Riemerella anatipestifer]